MEVKHYLDLLRVLTEAKHVHVRYALIKRMNERETSFVLYLVDMHHKHSLRIATANVQLALNSTCRADELLL